MKPLAAPLVILAAALLAACPGSDTGGGTPVGDGNDSFATAQTVAAGSATPGVISSAADHDWYKVTTTGGGAVTVSLIALSADADLELLDASQASLGSSTNTGTLTDTVTYTAAGAGTFYVHVIPVAAAATYTMTLTFTPAGGGDGNDTFATAQAVAPGSSTPGVISSASDDDWYAFTTAAAGSITISLSGLSGDANLALVDSTQAVLGSSANAGTATETVTYAAPSAGTFYVHVIPQAAGASYTMAVVFTPTAGGDGNDTFGTAQAVAAGATIHGVISSATDEDWYTFTTTGAGTITITLTGLSADANLALYNSTPTSLGSSANTGTANDTVSYTAAAAGTFYAQVLPQTVGASYTLGVIFTPAAAGDGNDTFATAQPLAIGATISGVISSSTDPDWYVVTTPGAGTITVTLSGLTADADLELYGAGLGFLVDQSQFAGTQNDTVSFTTGTAFTYRVLVKPLASSTPYTLTASFTP